MGGVPFYFSSFFHEIRMRRALRYSQFGFEEFDGRRTVLYG